jgi:23S rRNA pseudouridine1911/1915/1917 synthase
MNTTPTPSIIYEDDVLLVLAKPAGITVNKSETTIHEGTVQDWLEGNFTYTIDADPETDFFKRCGIVHRIDKETSGILLVAKTFEAFTNIQDQFKTRVVKKKYTALVHGRMPEKSGEINMPVGRLPWNTKRFGIVPGGKESVTYYHVEKVYQWLKKEVLSLVILEPKTGRTHQIRVHLKYLNRPIFSDYLYAGRKVSIADRKHLGRVFLHASEISFHHPTSGEEVHFVCPLPVELAAFLTQLEPVIQ